MKKLVVILASLILLVSCTTSKNIDTIDDNYRVMYQIFVGSFSDSNNDGIGDIRGIINRLDYLNDGNTNSKTSLGVQGLWLSPIFKSPSYHKYDVVDYYQIDSEFGNMDDLKKLVDECHSRNMIVILDLVLNHTSNQNEWFNKFVDAHQKNETDNYYYDFYTHKNSKENVAGKTWATIRSTNQDYECNFSTTMPELNFDNDNVRNELLNIAKYYLDLGIDGFRFDAAKYIYLNETKPNVEFWNWYITELKQIKPDIYTVGEVWSSDSETIDYIEALNCFNFTMSGPEGLIANAVKTGNASSYTSYVENYVNKIKEKNTDSMMINFISNHDMDRSAGYLMMMNKMPYIAANLLLLSPGSPFIYYGEEIAMKGSRGSSNTDANRRLAMLWGDNDTVRDPEGSSFESKKQTNGTVKSQLADENSLLKYYAKVIDIRNKYPQIARGEYSSYKTNNNIGGFLISYNNESTGLFHNTSKDSELSIDISDSSFKNIIEIIGLSNAKLNNNILTIGPQTSVILK